jgi:hypothetical protein
MLRKLDHEARQVAKCSETIFWEPMKKYLTPILAAAIALTALGCRTSGNSGGSVDEEPDGAALGEPAELEIDTAALTNSVAPLDLSGIIGLADAQIVGGGLTINWTAPTKGTAILVEQNSRRFITTESLDAGDTFRFQPLGGTNGVVQEEQLKMLLGMPPDLANLILYFRPAPEK